MNPIRLFREVWNDEHAGPTLRWLLVGLGVLGSAGVVLRVWW